MSGRAAEIAAVSLLAVVVTAVVAAPVLRAPSERLFGMEIVGRHHDPFTVMAQLTRPPSLGAYTQPITDITGALLARLSGPVAAYNWLVLVTFPLSAAAAYLLARHLTLSPAAAAVAAMAYAFSPFHLAHAAYHPHIAQTQWVPLYLLALWRCLDHASPGGAACLAAAAIAVTLSNFYAGLIAAVITPLAVAAYWLVVSRTDPGSTRRLGVTIAILLLVAGAGIGYASYAGSLDRAAFAFPRDDLFRYSAKWWSYLLPPVAHPLLGAAAQRIWQAAGVREGLLEQQASLGWAVVALGLVAILRWLRDRRTPSVGRVPVLVIVAAAALACSLSPERTIGAFTVVRPSALLYVVVPMFRSYARFAVVVQLMAALLAGIGVDVLRRAGTRRAQAACLALVALIAGEYVVSPAAEWRDVLPTAAHRWVMRQPGLVHAFDCTPLDQESESVQWLTGQRVTLAGGAIGDCAGADLPAALAANGYTHLVVRRAFAGAPFADQPAPEGLRLAARFDDGEVFAVAAQKPAVYAATMAGFFPREHDAAWTWQWMGGEASWTIVNTGTRPIAAALSLEMTAFPHARRLDVRLDGRPLQTIVVETRRRVYEIGPLDVPPGPHALGFHAREAPTVADDVLHNGDRRPVSFALGAPGWRVEGEGR